ncbi:5-formyltetrahydrofolate cyclo-ligase [Rickettsiales endosymbiont of Peranema trichophorum]|uniref:5-formyltetrahydrofolate cyclo-ligase n=1 Tax=Rickettsiales endosymbiont of Peranema trichophorum TaxID=2486577 RepID=UPI0013EEACDF|nr:5-formyltetrahydrofolate cyclo-ligase [Rickettsiales endosymbiont of Peranema trichophorum]
MNTKAKIRQELLVLRKNLSETWNEMFWSKLCDNLLGLIATLSGRSVCGYYPIKFEINMIYILAEIEKLGRYDIGLPRVVDKFRPLEFKLWRTNTPLEFNSNMGLHEPYQSQETIIPDLIMVPLLGFTRSCHRLGYGGGFYDRTLPHYPNAVSIGVAYSFQENNDIPTEPHDIPLFYIVTEAGIIRNSWS